MGHEARNGFEILKKQRDVFAVQLYWILMSFPNEIRISYCNYLSGLRSESNKTAFDLIKSRGKQFNCIEDLMVLARYPKVEITADYLNEIKALSFSLKNTNEFKKQIRARVSKQTVLKLIKDEYEKRSGHKLKAVGASVFRDEMDCCNQRGKIVIELDFGGWSQFREEISIVWNGETVFGKKSFCEWLGYDEVVGWQWVLQDDLNQAVKDAVDLVLMFRDALCASVCIADQNFRNRS